MTLDKQTKHFDKQCYVVIKKPKVRVFDLYRELVNFVINTEAIPTATLWGSYQEALKANERKRFRDLLSDKSKKKILIDPSDFDDYYYIVASNQYVKVIDTTKLDISSAYKQLSKSKSYDSVLPTNDRVISVNVSQNLSAPWSATVVLDNTADLFYLNDVKDGADTIFQEKDCIFEPNDEVKIYMSDWGGEVHCVFTGLINKIQDTDDGLVKKINLFCEDNIKKLSLNRTNASPSLDANEAEGDDITPFTYSWQDKKFNEVIRLILGRTYCNVLKDPSVLLSVASTLNSLKGNPQVKSINRSEYFKIIKNAIDAKILSNSYIDVISKDNQEVYYIGYECKLELGIAKRGKVVFVVSSLDQPAWGLTINSGSYDFLISDWKSNDQIIQKIAQETFFEFFADEEGIIHFRPSNLILPKLPTGSSYVGLKDKILNNYILTKDKEVYVRNFNKQIDDRALFTDIVVSGAYIEGSITHEMLKTLVIGPYSYRRKYGVRMMPQESKIGLTDIPPLKTYGELKLWRQNAAFNTASIDFELNSNIVPGNPMYVENWESVWYIDSVSHSFTAGGEGSTEVSLTYKRKPIGFVRKTTVGYSTSDRDNILTKLYGNQEISLTEKYFIETNFTDLVWGIYDISFSSSNYYTDLVANKMLGIPQQLNLSTEKFYLLWEPIPSVLYPGAIYNDNIHILYNVDKINALYNIYNQAIIQNSNNKYAQEEAFIELQDGLNEIETSMLELGDIAITVKDDTRVSKLDPKRQSGAGI